MKRRLTASIIMGVLSVAVLGSLYGQTYNPDFNAEAMKLRPAPTGYRAGKDNGPGKGLHNSGED